MSKTEKEKEKVEDSKVETIKKTFKFFNLETMKDEKSEEISITFTPPESLEAAMARIDETAALEAVTDYLRSRTVLDAKRANVPAGSCPKKVVLDFVKGYRVSPIFASMITIEKKGPARSAQYRAQTEAILSQVSQVPFMMENLRAIAAAAPVTVDGDGDDENENE